MGNSVWNFSACGVRDFDFNFVWYLSFDGVWDLSGNLNWLKGLDFVLFGNVISLSNLVWDLFNGHNWDFLGNLILLGHIFCDGEGVSVIGRVSTGKFSIVTNLSPVVDSTSTSKSTTIIESSESIATDKESTI